MPTASKFRPNKEFSLVSLIRSLSVDAQLEPGEGTYEQDLCGDAMREFTKSPGGPIRGQIIPVNRAESGGLSTGSFANGGALVSSGLTLAAALQPTLQIENLGANRVNLPSGDSLVSVPAIAGGGWVTEDGDIDCSEVLFGSAMRNPKEAAARLKISRRLFKQSGISEQEFRSLLQRTIAATIEAGLLAGTGTEGKPLGMLNDSQLNRETYSSTTALPTREKVGEFVADILQAGGDLEQVQILLSAADYQDSQSRVDPTVGDSALVEISGGRRRLAGVPVAFSPYVPSGRLIAADWSRVSVSYVGLPQLIANPYTYSESGLMELTVFQMVSYGVERRELLTVATVEA